MAKIADDGYLGKVYRGGGSGVGCAEEPRYVGTELNFWCGGFMPTHHQWFWQRYTNVSHTIGRRTKAPHVILEQTPMCRRSGRRSLELHKDIPRIPRPKHTPCGVERAVLRTANVQHAVYAPRNARRYTYPLLHAAASVAS